MAIERTPNGTWEAANSSRAAPRPANVAWRSGISVTSSRETSPRRWGQRISVARNERSSKHSAAPTTTPNSSLTGIARTRTEASIFLRQWTGATAQSHMVFVAMHQEIVVAEVPDDFLAEIARDPLGARIPEPYLTL